jgi:hypothetical protein|tara:strand:+ start:2880 stop:3113 length:234 start_codon:yes stop_codon:yes gene_type:complete
MSEQTMEYEVLNLTKIKAKVEEAGGKVGWLVDPDDPELWGVGLNAYALEGWTVVSSYVRNESDGSGEVTVILGRPVK